MAQPYIPSWGFKDPDEKRPKRFDAAGALASLGNPAVTSYEVVVEGAFDAATGAPVTTDSAPLLVTNVVFDPLTGFITFVWEAGTVGVRYRIRARLFFGPDWKIDQSADVTIAQL